jgi:chlorite dismutase
MKYAILVLMTSTKEWLSLSREQRNAFMTEELTPVFEKYANKVSARFLDAEAFTARCSDVVIFETEDLKQYYFLMEEIRDSKIFTIPYFQINDIIPCAEGGFVTFEKEAYNKK